MILPKSLGLFVWSHLILAIFTTVTYFLLKFCLWKWHPPLGERERKLVMKIMKSDLAKIIEQFSISAADIKSNIIET